MFFYSKEVQVGKFEVEKLANVWRPHLKSLPLNGYMSQNKTFTRNPQRLEKLSCTNLKFDLKLVTLAKSSLFDTLEIWSFEQLEKPLLHTPQTWTLKLSTTRRTLFHTFSQTLMLKLSTTWRTLFHTLWNLGHFEELSFTHFKLKTWNLKTLPHLRTYNTLKKFLPHLPLTWKSCKLLVCYHLEMNSHSLCKLKLRFSKGFFHFFYAIQAQNLSLLFVLTQCSFSCLVWAHNLLETTWKQARNERFKVHEMEQLY
jgi:hypothetical protein